VEQPFIGPMKMFGSPIKMSETPSCIRGYSPFLGEHNNQVLADVLGYSQEQLKALYDAKVIYHEAAVDRL
jgi:crotonobetainyl-CoA:carnitine CoA-transferase CaiB-like acyl-CoA transferase